MSKERADSRATEWLKSHGRVAEEATDDRPDPVKLAVFVSAVIGVVLYAALRIVGMDVPVSAGASIVAFVVLVPTLERYYGG